MAGKKYNTVAEKIDPQKHYNLAEAIKFMKESAGITKFNASVDIAVRLGIDPRHADQQVRGMVLLPAGTGKSMRVVVFAKGEKAAEAQAAGADIVGADDLVKRIQTENFLDFDAAVATPDLMGQVGRIGKILGPRGLMPNPKLGTVTFDVGQAVKDLKAGKTEFKAEKAGIVQSTVGRVNFSEEQLEQNIRTFLGAIMKAKPPAAKGNYVRMISLSTTMGPGVKIETAEAERSVAAA